MTSLHLAASKGFIEIVKILLDAGADVTDVDANGSSALQLARDNGHTEVAEYMEANMKGKLAKRT